MPLVLVMDHNAPTLIRSLEREGFKALIASSEERVLAAARSADPSPDIALIDLGATGGGFALAEKIRRLRPIPVVLLANAPERPLLDKHRNGEIAGWACRLGGPALVAATVDATLRSSLAATRLSSEVQDSLSSALMAHAAEGIVGYDQNLRYRSWNAFMEKFTELSARDVIGKRPSDFFPPGTEGPMEGLRERALKGETVSFPPQPFHVPQTGRYGWISGVYTPHRDGQGHIIGVLGFFKDVTSERRSRELVELLLAEADAGLWEWIPATDALTVNDRWEALLGYAPGELALLSPTWKSIAHPEDVPPMQDSLRRHLAGETPIYEGPLRLRAKDGEWVWVLARGKATEWDVQKKPCRVSGTIVNISSCKVSEAHLRAQRDLALALASVNSLPQALELCLDAALGAAELDAGALYFVEHDGLHLVHSLGLAEEVSLERRHCPPESELHRLVIAGKGVFVPPRTLGLSPNALLQERDGFKALAIVPFGAQGKILGAFLLGSRTRETWTGKIPSLLGTMAAQIGPAIAQLRAEESLRKSQEELQGLFNALDDFLFIFDDRGQVVWANSLVFSRLEYAEEELLGQPLSRVHAPQDASEAPEVFDKILRGEINLCTLDLLPRSGDPIPVEARFSRGLWGGKGAFFGVSRDISSRRQAERALHQANEALRQGLDQLRQRHRELAILNDLSTLLQTCLDMDEAKSIVAQQMALLFSEESGALYMAVPGKNILERTTVWGPAPPEEFLISMEDCWGLRRGKSHLVPRGASATRCRHTPPREDTSSLCIPVAVQGENLGLLHLRRDSAEFSESGLQLAQTLADTMGLALANLKLRETLRQQSIRDILTQLFNRRYMEETLDREIFRAQRTERPLGIIMLDIDRFKDINDRFGHAVGDEVLRQLAHLLQNSVRSGDVACRYGGEEFVLILPEASLAHTAARAEELRQAARAIAIPAPGAEGETLAISLGVAAFPDHGPRGENLLKASDDALYSAKTSGRDRVVVAPIPLQGGSSGIRA